jgi:hypothetical protein
VEGREGAGGGIRTHGGIDYRNRRWLSGSLPAEKGCGFPVFRAAGVIAAVLLGLILRRVIPCCWK